MDTGLYIFLAFIVLLVILITRVIIRSAKINKKERALQLEELKKTDDPPLEERSVTIVSKACGVEVFDGYAPGHENHFEVTFEDEYGEEFTLEVLEDFYTEAEEGQTGTVAIVNGHFYGFCVAEDE